MTKTDCAITVKSRFKKLWKYYLLQSAIATVVLFVLVSVLGREKMVLVGAFGATIFIVFIVPDTDSARAKNVIGSHIIAVASGALFCLIGMPYFFQYPLAVGLAIFLMVTLGVIHPPAAGTALAVSINPPSVDTLITILIATVVISLCRCCLKKYLKNLA